jgi:hypothetical protein
MLEPGCRTSIVVVMAASAALAGACTPDVGSDPIPTAMEMDLTATPPLAPQPTALIVNPQTKHIDFGLAGTPIPDDCSMQQALTEAQCQFDQWLQTLNGFPTVTPASAPASGPLDRATLTLGAGANVVVMAARQAAPATDLAVDFDTASSSITLTPMHGWTLGEFYWIGVRGYANGVRDTGGGEVVGSPTMALLKQDASLTCDAADPTALDPNCPTYQVLAQGSPSPAAAEQLFRLEAIRMAYIAGYGFDLMLAAGLPKSEIAVLWGFPIHTNSVPVLVPSAGAVPLVPAANQILVGVQGPVDPATVSAFSAAAGQPGPVVVVDLTALAAGNPAAAFPPVTATYVAGAVAGTGAIAIQASQPFSAGHQIGLFFTDAIHSPDAAPLVASPVSVLLRLTAPLVDGGGHSTVSGVADADAAALEAGRAALSSLFDIPTFTPTTGVSRANVIYAYAFIPVQP